MNIAKRTKCFGNLHRWFLLRHQWCLALPHGYLDSMSVILFATSPVHILILHCSRVSTFTAGFTKWRDTKRPLQIYRPLARYIKFWVVQAPGMLRRFSPPPRVSDSDMHHGTCVTHVPWCMPGSLTSSDGENVPGIPGACATHNFTYLARGSWSHAYDALVTRINEVLSL